MGNYYSQDFFRELKESLIYTPPSTVYVAGKWSNKPDINKRQADVRAKGYRITHDWTKFEDGNDRSNEYLGTCAEFDINGVKNADLVVVIMDDEKYPYKGTWTEIGCGLGLEKKVLVYCPDPSRTYAAQNCFFHHPLVKHFATWEDLLAEL